MMKKFIFVIALLAAFIGFAGEQFELAMGEMGNYNFQFGTDKSSTSFPNAGLNTTPTKMIGTDNHIINPNAPSSKPNSGFGGFGATPSWSAAPIYTPPPPPPQFNGSTTR